MLMTSPNRRIVRRSGFTLLEVLVVVAILVILAGVGVVATTRYLEDAKKSKAQMACQSIYQALESYKANPANPTQEYPQNGLAELTQPIFGGEGYLKNGQNDLLDPWGQQYQMTFVPSPSDPTGTSQMPVVYTQAKDGTKISQLGIGPKSGLQ